MLDSIVKIYLIVLTLSGVVGFFGMGLIRWLRRRRRASLEPAHKLFARAFFHFVTGGVLLFFFTSKVTTSWVALILAAVLLIGFEYAMVITSNLLQARWKRSHPNQPG
jgi:hypothetical protein